MTRPRTLFVLWAAFIVACEVVFRRVPAEWIDVPGVGALAVLVFLTHEAIEKERLAVPLWLIRAGARIWSAVRRLGIQVGVDLRHEPQVPAALPVPIVGLLIGLGAALAAALMIGRALPGDLRTLVISVSAFVYVLYAALLWTALLALSLTIGFFVWIHLHDRMINRHPQGTPSLRSRIVLAAVPLALALGAALLLPAGVPAALVAGLGAAAVVLSLMQRREDLKVLWRSIGREDPIRSLDLRWWVAGHTLLTTMLVLLGMTVASGAEWLAGSGTASVVTPFLGRLTGWIAVLGGATWLWAGPGKLLFLARRVPPVAPPLIAYLPSDARIDDALRKELKLRGVRVLPEGRPHSSAGALRISLDTDRTEEGIEWDPSNEGIPACEVHPAALTRPGVLATLRQADRALNRRELLEGLELLIEQAAQRRFRQGTGFWLAPHLWYISAMTRDTNEEDSITVGPPYHEVLSPASRRHAFEVFRALSIDLIYFEDGLPFSALERVLVRMFDRVDLWGVEPLEERHVHGIPGVRILIHSFDLQTPLEREHYPEPDYEQIGRARILHIMKDRGGPGDADLAPEVPDLVPEIVGV